MPRNRPLVFDLVLTVADTHAWRRVRVSSGATLARARRVFCVAFEWPGGRPYAFSVGHLRYESRSRRDEIVHVRLRQLLSGAGAGISPYSNSSAAPAVVRVRVDCVLPAHDGMTTPVCLAGEGRAPQDIHATVPSDPDDEEEYQQSGSSRGVHGRRVQLNLAVINAELLRLR